MRRGDEFDAFYERTRRHVLHLAYAFTGDLAVAVAATQDAYAGVWARWSRLRHGEPLEHVRHAALNVETSPAGAHVRVQQPVADEELHAGLRALSPSARRLVVLQEVAGLDQPAAAVAADVSDEEGRRLGEAGLRSLQESVGAPAAQVRRRLQALGAVAADAALPSASVIRRSASRRSQRSTALAVVAGSAVLLGGGYLVTAPAQPAQSPLPVAATGAATPSAPATPAPVRISPSVTADQLLDITSLTALGDRRVWREAATSDDLTDQEPLATCARGRFASEQLLAGYTRTFAGDPRQGERAVQTVELADSPAAAGSAYETQLSWYSGCQEPRVQLMESFRADRSDADTVILVLRRWAEPRITLTVGVARTGSATTTLVHEVHSDEAVNVEAFSDAMDAALGQLCFTTEGTCESSARTEATPAPPTGEGTGFLGVVDLPPVASIAKAWAGTEPVRWRRNPPATPCDAADFSAAVERARSRDYLIPQADQVPLTFGIRETIARFRSVEAARGFVSRSAAAVQACDDDPGTEVSEPSTSRQGPTRATAWQLSFQVDDDEVRYRMGMVLNAERVAQVTFSPVDRYDIGRAAYGRLLLRVGQRLAELPDAADLSPATR
jgi:DNA-directed RNA polymerase specialized sigma24 family protein